MPTLIQSDVAKGVQSSPYPSESGVVVSKRAFVTIPAGAVLNDIFEMLSIPATCKVCDAILDTDDLDTNGAPTITLDVGIMSGNFGDNDNTRTVGAELFSADASAKTGACARPSLKTAFRISASNAERGVGIKISAAAATPAAGTVGLTLFYVAD